MNKKTETKNIFKSYTAVFLAAVLLSLLFSQGISLAASVYLYDSKDVGYNNVSSGLVSTNVQDAIDEVYAAATDYSGISSRLTTMENNFLDKTYPVGSIYIGVNNTNPSTLFGGTWESFGSGRKLVGMGSNGTDNYTTVESTGGSSAKTLDTTNLPAHSHTFSGTTDANNRGHTHTLTDRYFNGHWGNTFAGAGGGITSVPYAANVAATNNNSTTTRTSSDVNQSHTHTFSGTTSSIGDGDSFSTMDPYVTVYMWKRTA